MEIECRHEEYRNEKHRFINKTNVCYLKRISRDSPRKEIKLQYNQVLSYVEWFHCNAKPMGFVPKNLHKVFPRIKYLTIRGCGLEEISREDFIGLGNLEFLDFCNNKLTFLPDDLFTDTRKLREIYFYGNTLERLSSKLFMPFKRTLEKADFTNNTKINEQFNLYDVGKNDLEKFLRAINSIDEQPQATPQEATPPEKTPPEAQAAPLVALPEARAVELVAEFLKFKKSGEFADFTITVRGKEFKIHKMVFAAQSSVFKKIFREDAEELSKSFNKIKSFSEESFEAFLDYFYTGKVEAAVNAMEMFELASEFDVARVKKICTVRILAQVDEKNAVEVFNLGHRFQSDELRRKSFEVILKIFPQLDASFENKLDKVNQLVALKKEMDAVVIQG